MKVVVCLLVATCAVNVYSKILPDYMPQCKRNNPELETCILEAIETVRPRLNEGIPEINVPAYEPLVIPTLKIDRTAPSLRIKAIMKNMKVHGPSKFKIEKFKLNLNNKYAGELRLILPRLSVSCDYDIRGSRILVLDLDGKGKLRGNFTGITVAAKGSAKVIQKEGVDYLQIDKLAAKVRIKDGEVAFDDTERPLVAASAQTFFNASPGVVLDILNPLIEDTGAAIFKAVMNKIFATIPLKELLLED